MDRLKTLMEKHHIKTQYALATRSGIPYKVVNNWFKGRATPGAENLLKLAAYFHVEPAWLQHGDAAYAPTLENDAMVVAEEIARYGPDAIKWVRDNLQFLYGRPQPDQQPAAIQEKKKAPVKRRTA